MEQETKQKEILLVIFNILKIISIGIVPLLAPTFSKKFILGKLIKHCPYKQRDTRE